MRIRISARSGAVVDSVRCPAGASQFRIPNSEFRIPNYLLVRCHDAPRDEALVHGSEPAAKKAAPKKAVAKKVATKKIAKKRVAAKKTAARKNAARR